MQVPNAMLVYGSYELYKREISAVFPQLNVTQTRLISAMLGDITGKSASNTLKKTAEQCRGDRNQLSIVPLNRAQPSTGN